MTTTIRFRTRPLVRALTLASLTMDVLGPVNAQAQTPSELNQLRQRAV